MRKVLVIININKSESLSIAQDIKDFLFTKKIETDFLSFDGFCDNVSFKGYDFVITLGGDGTVLFAARNSVEENIPVFPVNLGQFGFICQVQPKNWKKSLESFLNEESEIQERAMFLVEVFRENKKIYSSLSLNDAVISAKRSAITIPLNIKYDSLQLCKINADGIIISTATGSTAYSAAAGGPILDSQLDAFVLTPVNSFSLSSRPIVLNSNCELEILVEKGRTKDVCITVDGQEPFDLVYFDKIVIKQYDKKVKLICCTKEKFYNALRSKLNWTGGPHA